MENSAFFELLRSLTHLTTAQLERVGQHVNGHLQHDLLSQALGEQSRELPGCPHCQSPEVIHWGQYKGILRYRCKKCGKTFNQLHNTPLKRMRHKAKWVAYAKCLRAGCTLRNAAARCGISLTTSFRWRHRFLKYARTTEASRLAGIIEADEVFIPESFKGKRQIPRPARKRGGAGRGRVPLVPVLVALDRYGNEADKVLMENSLEQINSALKPLLTKGSVLCTDGNCTYQSIVKEVPGVAHKRLIAVDNIRVIEEVFHIQTLNSYVSSWRSWMVRFMGVGTAYLQNYLAWYRLHHKGEDGAESWIRGGLTAITNN